MDRSFLFIMGAINSALYLASIVAAGLVLGNVGAAYCAIATFGIAFLGYAMQFLRPQWVQANIALVSVSWAAGGAAFLFLIIG